IEFWSDSYANSGAILFNTAFGAAYTEKMRIDKSGNVGIGTTGPATNLDVTASGAGGMVINQRADAATYSGLLYLKGSTQTYGIRNANGLLSFSYGATVNTGGGTAGMVMDTNGNVGIGTTNPVAKLQVVDGYVRSTIADGNYNGIWENNGGANNEYLALYQTADDFIFTSNKNGAGVRKGININTTGGDTSVSTGGIYIKNDGNVGIGTTDPLFSLSVGAPVSTLPVYTNPSAGHDQVFIRGTNTDVANSWLNVMDIGMVAATNGSGGGTAIRFITQPRVTPFAPLERMRIDMNGNVGIGTTGPTAPLTIQTNTGGSSVHLIGRLTGNYSEILFRNNANTSTVASFYNNDDWAYWGATAGSGMIVNQIANAPLSLKTNDTERVTILGNGNVGIGTTNPGQKLDVNGNVQLKSKLFVTDSQTMIGDEGVIGGGSATGDSILSYFGGKHLTIAEGTTPVMTIDGNVGIGTTNPTSKLTIDGIYGTANYIDMKSNIGTTSTETNGVLFTNMYPSSQQLAKITVGTESQLYYGYMAFSTVRTGFANVLDERMRIQQNGNVGIGTTSPGYKSTVYDASGNYFASALQSGNIGTPGNWVGQLYGYGIGTGYNKGATMFQSIDGTGRGNFYVALNTAFDDTNVTLADAKLTILNGGNVGIGTTVPAYKLQLQDGVLFVNRSVYSAPSGEDGYRIKFTDVGGVDNDMGFGLGTTNLWLNLGRPEGARDFTVYAQSSNPLVTIKNTGNVGIGTTGPGAKLDVYSTGTDAIKVSSPLGTDLDAITVYSGSIRAVSLATSASYGGAGGIALKNSAGTNTVVINGGTNGNSYFNSGGNVGIGTTGPVNKLSITGSPDAPSITAASGLFRLDSVTTTGFSMGIQNASPYGTYLQSTNTPATGGGAYPLLLNPLGGNVGIGTTNPLQKLEVSGTIRQTGCTTAGTISVNTSGDIICTSSSIRFKNNRNDLQAGLQILTQLKPVSYIFNENMSLGKDVHFGFISEEVNSIDQALATHDATGAPYGLDSTAILAVTVNAVKELNLKLENVNNMETDNSFRSILISWFGNISNGIQKLYTKELNTDNVNIADTLCVSDATGAKTCVNKAQLDSLLASAGGAVGGGGGSNPPPVVEKTATELLADANTKLNAVVIENYTTDSAASFATAKDAAVALAEENDEEKLIKVKAIEDALALLILKPVPPTCVAPQILEGDTCIDPPLTCTPPQVPVDGVCADPLP
ncbi:MAG: tail fiber domain-containing protein, partial [Candidatus Paceibacterota bacterium]